MILLGKSNKEFEIVGSSDADKFMRINLGLFQGNITFDEKYRKVVQEFQNNSDRINMHNLLKAVQNNGKKGIQK